MRSRLREIVSKGSFSTCANLYDSANPNILGVGVIKGERRGEREREKERKERKKERKREQGANI